ncbi:signal transduction histidine kinase [Cercophora newfieldiana]|uniref:Signal transduction histidine kinase n=1 Tax=Cercophora newfieldiana TaxID=92897 RepID=A0AA39Y4C1_9PEZI|nr:signal transduction histidine kinase [Cercophora newfieldiana]
MPDFGDHVDMEAFNKVLEMDDNSDDREFSRAIVQEYFDQFETTIQEIDAAFGSQNLPALAKIGHFLGNSSAVIGFTKISQICELIKMYGSKRQPDGTPAEVPICLSNIQTAIADIKPEYEEVKKIVLEFYKSG